MHIRKCTSGYVIVIPEEQRFESRRDLPLQFNLTSCVFGRIYIFSGIVIYEISVIFLIIGCNRQAEIIGYLAVIGALHGKLSIIPAAQHQRRTLERQRRERINIHYPANGISAVKCSLCSAQNLDTLNILKFKIECRRIETRHIIYIQTYGLRT
ncbi:hypothetical protein SDC9_83493 [bioreactor metagenome]|uniref:Uncharacterized protein n=1 Tax=bioreactor metagenome TaxID=1076179 RepID=A0A644Z8D9_9ZZZZ